MNDKIIAGVAVSTLAAALVVFAPRHAKKRAALEAPVPAVAAAASEAPAAPEAAPAALAEAPVTTPVTPTAAKAEPAPAVPAPAVVSGKQLWGVVDSVDAAGRMLAVKDKRGRVHALAVASQAAITLGGENKRAALSDLKPGDNVTVTTEGGAAREIHIRVLFSQSGALERADQPHA
jgi:hypothetical protein